VSTKKKFWRSFFLIAAIVSTPFACAGAIFAALTLTLVRKAFRLVGSLIAKSNARR
jgi:hypothetical protein